MDTKRYLDNRFDKLLLLHESEKTEVWLVMERQTQNIYILKIIQRTGLPYSKMETLQHRGIPQIHYVHEDGACTYVMEEYLKGQNLAQYIMEHGHLPEGLVKNLAIELCRILAFLHMHHIIHRDIKPSNIFLTDDMQLKLIDFDAARIKKENQQADTVCLGTDGFAAPEQYGSRPTDERSDVYSLGITLRVLLGENYDGALNGIIAKCTEFDARYRFQSMEEMETALKYGTKLIQENLHKRLIYDQIHHALFVLFVLGFALCLLSVVVPSTFELFLGRIIFVIGFCVWHFRKRYKKIVQNREILLGIAVPKTTVKNRVLWGMWYYLAWLLAILFLIAGTGLTYNQPWGPFVTRVAFVIPSIGAYFCIKWRAFQGK